jgi:hypothetical protein
MSMMTQESPQAVLHHLGRQFETTISFPVNTPRSNNALLNADDQRALKKARQFTPSNTSQDAPTNPQPLTLRALFYSVRLWKYGYCFGGSRSSRFHQPPPRAWNNAAVSAKRLACAWTRVSSAWK